jgi:hypothetical protein
MLKKGFIFCLALLAFAICFQSCTKKLKPASYQIVDQYRHYFPIRQGTDLECSFEIRNKCSDPLFINEIQTSCGCIKVKDKLPLLIFPHKSNFIRLSYDSTKNIGYVRHTIYCYGNFKDTSMIKIVFAVNVVPKNLTWNDYEDLFEDKKKSGSTIREAVDGKSNEKGYYIDMSLKAEPDSNTRYFSDTRFDDNDIKNRNFNYR